MKNKAPLALMEQVLMTLVFALAAALCIQVFVFSGQTSRRNEARDRAVLMAQNAVETLKACGGSMEDAQTEAAELMGGTLSDGVWYMYYDGDWNTADPENAAYWLEAREIPSQTEGLAQAEVIIFAAEDAASSEEPLFALPAAWQEVQHGE